MKTSPASLAWKLVIFLLPIFIGFAWLEVKLTAHPTVIDKMGRAYENERAEVEVAVLGTSHLAEGILSSECAVPTFNAAAPVQSLVISTQLGRKFVRSMPKLRGVILEAAYFSRDHTHFSTSAAPQLYQYFRSFGIRGDGDWKEQLDLRYYSRYFVLGREAAFSLLFDPPPPPYDDSENRVISAKAAASAVAYHEELRSPRAVTENLQALQAFVGLLRSHKIPLVIVRAPATEFYRQALPAGEFQLIFDELRKAAGEEGVKYADYFADSRFQLKHFYNTDHLNEEGRRLFTQLINTEVYPVF